MEIVDSSLMGSSDAFYAPEAPGKGWKPVTSFRSLAQLSHGSFWDVLRSCSMISFYSFDIVVQLLVKIEDVNDFRYILGWAIARRRRE